MNELTEAEQQAIDLTVDLIKLFALEIVKDGPAKSQDINEAVMHIHSIQRMVLAQAAARAYPDKYRLLGQVIDV